MKLQKGIFLSIRALLAITFLWVVADRISLLGPAGKMGVVWGNFDSFLEYTATLNPWLPRGLSDFLGYVVTILEVVIAALLIWGYRLKETSLATIGLLAIFTFSMIFSIGFNKAFDFIIFTIVLTFITALLYWNSSRPKKS